MQITRPIVFFDLETTGVNPEKDRIIEIAVVKISPYEEKGKTITKTEEKTVVLNPILPIPAQATEVHGFTDEKVKDCPKFIEISKSLYSFFHGCDFGGFNSDHYDIPLLSKEFFRCNINFPDWDCNFVDVLKLERILNPNNLSAVYKRYTGKELDGAHGATADIKATIEILMNQLEKTNQQTLTPEEIDVLCQADRKRFDVGGKCYIDKEGVVRWAFGKNINEPVLNDLNYIQWVLSNDFASDLKSKLRQLTAK